MQVYEIYKQTSDIRIKPTIVYIMLKLNLYSHSFTRCRFAITTGVVGDYESPRVRIQTGVIFKVTTTSSSLMSNQCISRCMSSMVR